MAEQNYLIYTKVGGVNVTVAPQQLDFTLTRNEETHLSLDLGVDNFEDVDHLGSFVITARDTSGLAMMYALTNTPDDALAIRNGTGLQIRFFHASGPDENRINLLFTNAGSVLINDDYISYILGTRLWWRLTRVGSLAVLRLYDDSGRTNLIATLSGTGDTTKFRYHEPLAAWNNGNAFEAEGIVYGTDLQEAAAAAMPLINGGLINNGLTTGRLIN